MEKRKQGRPPLPRNIEEYVITAAMKNPGMKRLALVDKVEKELRELKLTPPAKDTMLKLFQKAPKPGKEDVQWSLAKSVEHGFSPEATSHLFNVWSFCLAAGFEFTVRQAKWVCYLRSTHFVPQAELYLQTSYLYSVSALYSTRERICEALKIDVDTYDLDAFVGLPVAEIKTALRTGILDHKRFRAFPKDLPQTGIDKIRTNYWGVTHKVLDDLGFHDEIESFDNPHHKRPKLEEEFFSIEEIDHINAYWLRYISKAPKWGNLSHEEQKNIIFQLQSNIEAEVQKEGRRKFNQYLLVGWWEPTKLLNTLGYKVTDNRFGYSINEDVEKLYQEVGR